MVITTKKLNEKEIIMLTENTLKIFNIISEDIHLPHGTKSAKIVCHVDLDGVTSGISMVNQLVKQGIPRERITVEFAQYGDEDKEKKAHTQKFVGRKGEFVGVTDFAKLPTVCPWQIFRKLTSFKGTPAALLNILHASYESKANFEAAINKQFTIQTTKWTSRDFNDLYEAYRAYKALEKLYVRNKKVPFTEATAQNIQTLKYPLVTPDFVSDHHSNEQGALNGGQRGEIATGSPSEAEFFANKYTPGLWSQDDLKAISMVDSAGYTEEQLKNTVFLEKHFTGSDRKKNIATIISCIYDNLCKKDRNAAAWVVKNAQPSLVSLYSCTLKAAGYNGKRLEYVSALKAGDIEKAKQLLSEIPSELNKRYDRRGDPKTPIMNLQQWQKKNADDIANMKTGRKSEADNKKLEEIKGKRGAEFKEIRDSIKGKKGKIMSHNNFAIFDGSDPKTQYTRYATTLYSKNGQREPFSMRYWGTFFQIAKSTLYKGTVNFAEVNEHVLQDVKAFLTKEGYKGVNKVIDIMKEKNGGHSGGIWSFQGFSEIKPDYKEFTDKERAKYYLAKRLSSDLAKKVVNDYDGEGGVNTKYTDLRKRCMRYAMNSAVYWTNKLYPPRQEDLDALKTNDKDFNED